MTKQGNLDKWNQALKLFGGEAPIVCPHCGYEHTGFDREFGYYEENCWFDGVIEPEPCDECGKYFLVKYPHTIIVNWTVEKIND